MTTMIEDKTRRQSPCSRSSQSNQKRDFQGDFQGEPESAQTEEEFYLILCKKELALKLKLEEIRDAKKLIEKRLAEGKGLPQMTWIFE